MPDIFIYDSMQGSRLKRHNCEAGVSMRSRLSLGVWQRLLKAFLRCPTNDRLTARCGVMPVSPGCFPGWRALTSGSYAFHSRCGDHPDAGSIPVLMPRSSVGRSYFALVIVLLSSICLLLTLAQPSFAQRGGSAQSAGGFAPGARASASANATLDSVVGNRPSPVRQQVGPNGVTYRVMPSGTLLAPDGHAVAGGCPAPASIAAGQFIAGGAPAEPALKGKAGAGIGAHKDETVMIGVTDQAVKQAKGLKPAMRPRATMNASFGPPDVYVLAEPCRVSGTGKQAMIEDAAASLASAGGNIFALAGNRTGVVQANSSATLPDGDVVLSLDRPDHAEPRLAAAGDGHDAP